MEQPKAAFSIIDYYFDQVNLNLKNKLEKDNLSIDFSTHGIFKKEDKSFDLNFNVSVSDDNGIKTDPFVFISCIGKFSFDNVNTLSEIPEFFYVNSIALLFPYVRAYISLITTQANIKGIILPTLNLSGLGKELKCNTKEE